ncbi:alpha/beta hydrolase [Mycobacterium sp. CBMA247]|nr:alpha/beta hydrolase [Mycolicibacterium sp. CBMA 329]MUL89806.1 alpha/beta hydrolase [Mycolicibacterium sp. CBMA 331]MUL99980.1 alpha/beta hydrolase [Mycolicibacterium sp. CBMA 334]MUM28066.1 alpha/beta hydrolase [Mycolicibacterium sp. CBMA 295]MUM39321.1 alpha/beta hydrolase [Mycolicibacterium sp. CBMA 247]MUM46407.1 alpha/beta hydrolase [Mycolicibacterium sp. CBMA 294]
MCLAEIVLTPTERLVDTNGVTLKVTEAGERGNPVVVLAHGFPELAYSWRHQIPALAAAGYHVLAPDQRGYGGSSRPEGIDAYNIVELTADISGLLDDVGAEQAVLVGHDWGSPVVTTFPLFFPDRVSAVVAMSVPPVPRASAPPTQIWRKMIGDNFFYILYFQEPGVADAALGADPRESLRRMITLEGISAPPEALTDRPLPPLPDWITPDEFERYVTAFTETGFTGPLNWYRNFDRNWELTDPSSEAITAQTITVPTLFLGGTADPVLSFTPRDRVRDVVTGDYREVLLDGAGHWLQQERPDEVNAALLEFLGGLK